MTEKNNDEKWNVILDDYFEEDQRNLMNELIMYEMTISKNLDQLQLALRDKDQKKAKEILFTIYKKTNYLYNKIFNLENLELGENENE
jgi:hypothetical protein